MRNAICFVAVLVVWFLGQGQSLSAQQPENTTESAPASSRLEGFQLQPGDPPLQAFEPKKPETKAEKERADALARYMSGRIHQERGDLEAALQAYQQAIEIDPKAIDSYKSALPILLQRRDYDKAREWTLQAAEQNPEGYELVLAMAAIFAQQDLAEEGIALLSAALKLPDSQPKSLNNLLLHRDLGLYYRLQQKYEQASKEYQIVFDALMKDTLSEEERNELLVDPGEIYDEFGEVFLKASQPELALKAFEQASKHREARPGLHSYNLATVFRQTGKPEQALKELQHYFDAQLQTRGRAAYDLLKDLLKELGRESELVGRLEEMLKKDEHNDVLRFYLADVMLDAGKLDRARELYTKGREEVTDPRAMVGMVSIYRQEMQTPQLLQVLTKAFQSVPRGDDQSQLQQMAPDVRTLSERFEAALTALKEDEKAFDALTAYARQQEKAEKDRLEFFQAYLLGKLATENDHTKDALHFYRLAISMRNDPPSILYREIAAHLIDSEHYQQAIDLLTEAANHTSSSLQRDRWVFLFLLSYPYESLGQTDQAVEVLHEAQQLQPNMARLHYQEAWIYYHARRWEKALELFEKVIRDYPGEEEIVLDCRFRISNIYVEQGNPDQGIQVLEEVLASQPDNIQANNDLGYLLADQNRELDRAEKMIRKAVEKEPDNPAYLDSLGWVLYRQEDFDQAVKHLKKATTLEHGDDSTIFDHLGDAQQKLGNAAAAESAWNRALEIEQKKKVPNDKLLKSLRNKLNLPEKTADAATEQP